MKEIIVAVTLLYFMDVGDCSTLKKRIVDSYKDDTSLGNAVPVIMIVIADKMEQYPSKLRNVPLDDNQNDKVKNTVTNVGAEYFDFDVVRKFKDFDQDDDSPALRRGSCQEYHSDCLRYCMADRHCQTDEYRGHCGISCDEECRHLVPCPQEY